LTNASINKTIKSNMQNPEQTGIMISCHITFFNFIDKVIPDIKINCNESSEKPFHY